MRTVMGVAIALFLVTACAPLQVRKASESEVLLAAKRLSAKNCLGGSSGCSYSPFYKNGEWHVIVGHFEVDKRGNRIYELGNYSDYVFDSSGQYIKTLPGS